jgi:hypothetical protein
MSARDRRKLGLTNWSVEQSDVKGGKTEAGKSGREFREKGVLSAKSENRLELRAFTPPSPARTRMHNREGIRIRVKSPKN